METKDNKSKNWSKYYQNQKTLWYDPRISIFIKALVRIVELHRSDSKGWCISIRRIVSELGIARNTVMKYLNTAIDLGLIEATTKGERKRRKLKLSVSLRAPVEFNLSNLPLLSHPIRQPVLQSEPKSDSPVETVNNKVNIKAINNESRLNKKDFEIPQPTIPQISSAYRKFLEKRKELGI